MSTELKLDEPGTLVRPGPIGRLVRSGFAALCIAALWNTFEQRADLHPINLRTQLESKAKLFQVKADIVNEIINLEIALIKVKRVQGLLAR